MNPKVWLITGTSKGFGKVWAKAALEHGDKVIATARNTGALEDLVSEFGDNVFPLQLDVTDRENCFEAVKTGVAHFSRIDVLISNAGYGQFGFVEELTEDEARKQMETNFFGSLWMIQAALPSMREQQSGRIIQVSSIAGVTAFPNLGIYHASKWAIEGLCEAMSKEVESFNIKVTLVEPGGYATDWGNKSAKHSKPINAYNKVKEVAQANRPKLTAGDPNATGEAILKLVNAENPPLRLFLGAPPFKIIEPIYKSRLETWKSWQKVSEDAQSLKGVHSK